MVLSKRRATCKFQTRSQTQIRIKFSNTNLGILVSNTNLSSPPPSQSQAPLEWSSCPTSRNLMGYNYWAIVLISKHLNFCYLFPSLPSPAVERGGVSGSMGMSVLSCQTKSKKVHVTHIFVIIKHCHFRFPSLPSPAVERDGISGSMGMSVLSCQNHISEESFQISIVLVLTSCGKGWRLRFHGNCHFVLPKESNQWYCNT